MKRLSNGDSPISASQSLIDAWVVGDSLKPRPQGTQRAYRRAIRLWLEFLARQPGFKASADASLWKVNLEVSRTWQVELVKGKSKPATINQLLSSVSSFYKYTIANHLAPAGFRENPFHSRVLRLRVGAYEKARVLTTAEYRQLMNYLRSLSNAKSHLRAHAMIRILLHTGWRASELLAMRAGDLKPTSFGGGGMRYRCALPDGRGFVDHLPADCVAHMEEYLAKMGRPFETLADDEYIWPAVRAVNMAGLGVEQDRDNAVQMRSVLRMVRTYLRDAGIPNYESICLPDLRHTHAAILHEGGATMETIYKRMRFVNMASAERLVKSVLSDGEVDDVSAYFLALRKDPDANEQNEKRASKKKPSVGKPNNKNPDSPQRQHRTRKDSL